MGHKRTWANAVSMANLAAADRANKAGAGKPKGRLYHVCFGAGDGLQVFDIWESQQAFDKFGETLMPILQEVGLDPGEPMVEPVHSVIPG